MGLMYCNAVTIKKVQKQVSIKKISKKKSDIVAQWMHWLTKCINNKCHAHNDHTMATLFNNHPYISSSGTLVGTKFTATYVGMVVE